MDAVCGRVRQHEPVDLDPVPGARPDRARRPSARHRLRLRAVDPRRARLAHEGSALGVDLSSSMLAVARRRATAEGVPNVDFRQADAQVYAFDPGTFDLAISRFGVMFFEDRTAAFTDIASALRSGGRLAMLAWQDIRKNEWIMTVRETLAAGRDLPMPPAKTSGPMALADQDDVRGLLAGAGFESIGFTSIEEPVWFGADSEAAYEFVGEIGIVKGLSDGLDPDTKAAAHEPLEQHSGRTKPPRGFGSAAAYR